MTFPNAHDGVKKIYRAEIISLIAAVLSVVAAIVALVGIASNGDGVVAGVLGGGVLLIAAAVLGVIAFILQLVGLNKAKVDEVNFKNALIAVVVGIVAGIVMGAAQAGSLLSDLGETVTNICNTLCTWYVCTGIIALAERLGKTAMAERAEKVRKLLMIVWGATIVLDVLSTIFGVTNSTPTFGIISSALAIFAAILEIVVYFLYLKLLSRATRMLET